MDSYFSLLEFIANNLQIDACGRGATVGMSLRVIGGRDERGLDAFVRSQTLGN